MERSHSLFGAKCCGEIRKTICCDELIANLAARTNHADGDCIAEDEVAFTQARLHRARNQDLIENMLLPNRRRKDASCGSEQTFTYRYQRDDRRFFQLVDLI